MCQFRFLPALLFLKAYLIMSSKKNTFEQHPMKTRNIAKRDFIFERKKNNRNLGKNNYVTVLCDVHVQVNSYSH